VSRIRRTAEDAGVPHAISAVARQYWMKCTASREQTIRTSDTSGATREIASERHIFRLLIAVDKWITGIVPFSWLVAGARNGPQPGKQVRPLPMRDSSLEPVLQSRSRLRQFDPVVRRRPAEQEQAAARARGEGRTGERVPGDGAPLDADDSR